MDRFEALGRGMQIMLVGGVLLLIDTFLNWQSIDVGPIEVGQSAWHGFWGVVLGLLTIALILWVVARVAAIDLPLPISPTLTAAGLAVLIAVFALIKNLDDDYSSVWAWIGLVLAGVILVGAWLQVQATGGMDALKRELPSMPASSAPASEAPPTPPPAPPPPPAAPAPAASAPEPATTDPEAPESSPSGSSEHGERED